MKKQELDLSNIDYWYMNEINLNDRIDFGAIDVKRVNLIAGVDVAYTVIDNIEYGICCILVFDLNFNLMEKVTSYLPIGVPYKPGYLGMRELPVIIEAYKKLKTNPDIFMLDGNGYLHFCHLGIATMFSIVTKIPSIGIAKNYYKIDGIKYYAPDNVVGSVSYLEKDHEIYGVAMRSKQNCNPIFISVGNNMSLDNAIFFTKMSLSKESRIPIPTRLADIDTHIERKKFILMKTLKKDSF